MMIRHGDDKDVEVTGAGLALCGDNKAGQGSKKGIDGNKRTGHSCEADEAQMRK
jgi:hypothetical protein